jgi:lysozyme
MRVINERGLRLINDFEKFSPVPYDDGFGYRTIGWGHRMQPADPNTPITLDEANELQQGDLHIVYEAIERGVKVPVNDNQYAALVSITYNVGRGRPDPKGRDGIFCLRDGRPSTLIRKLNAGDYAGAAEQFLLWNKAGGVEVRGLTRRRVAERELYLLPPTA